MYEQYSRYASATIMEFMPLKKRGLGIGAAYHRRMAAVIQGKIIRKLPGRERTPGRRPALAPNHPEKILVCTQEMAGSFPEEYAALRKAILAGCQYCESAANRSELIDLLHERLFVSVSKETLANCLSSRPQTGVVPLPTQGPLIRFDVGDGNRASRERAAWILNSLTQTKALPLDQSQRRRCLEAFKV